MHLKFGKLEEVSANSDHVIGLGIDGPAAAALPLLWLPLLLLLLVPLRVRVGELRSAVPSASWREMIRDQCLGREKRRDGGGMVRLKMNR
ncbi:hypothetical protein Q3G72_028904 [Acer saccharum]|nr:hypothetical protein Q3G72_028904 [Acer saccharum]